MSGKSDILAKLRRVQPADVPLPADVTWGITYPDPADAYARALESVSGRCVRAIDPAAINAELETIAEYAAARKVVSRVPGIGRSDVDYDAIEDPHVLADVDFAILPGAFAVAENAAVWITDAHLKHRVLPFITQHLAFVVPADQVLNNMHEAYARLSFGERRFGAFVSGPSKTADIEQSLVVGAHGARSLTVFLLGSR